MITSELAVAFSLCKRKAFLLMKGERGEPCHPFVSLIEDRASTTLCNFHHSSESSGLKVLDCHGKPPEGKADIFINALVRYQDLAANVDALVALPESAGKNQPNFLPHIAIGTKMASQSDKTRLAFITHILGKGKRQHSATGATINVSGSVQRFQMAKMMASVSSSIEELRSWAKELPSSPSVLLNDHCAICPFKKMCLEQAEKDDSLTLLDRMTPRLIQRYQRKGIFTATQLSYLFKPRRRSKLPKDPTTRFNLELQALALRTNMIYLHQAPDIPSSPTELFLDIEGIPEEGSHYLIGVIVRSQAGIESHSFWADSPGEENSILTAFLSLANQHPDAPIYHYGSYDPKALRQMAEVSEVPIDSIISRLVNVSAFIFGNVYFPSRSNSLKELGRLCGATWRTPEASGLMSVVWRMKWQFSQSPELKQQILEYNIDDCNALALLVAELRNLGRTGNARKDVDYTDDRKWNTTPSGQQIHDSLEGVLRSAHLEYEKNRIELRKQDCVVGTEEKRRGGRPQLWSFRRNVPDRDLTIIRVRRRLKCPRHKGVVLVPSERMTRHIVVDLSFTKKGCTKRLLAYSGLISMCPLCNRGYVPAAINRIRYQFFGHRFQAWVVYQRITLRLPYRVIAQVAYDLFRETISPQCIVNCVSYVAKFYDSTQDLLLQRILASPFIHVDETKISIRGRNHYVWVLTDGEHVVFRLTETRETSVIQMLLKDYTGTLVTDFYGGYDACPCRQQKCLVHLIRDLNDDLWKNPFNLQLESFVGAVRDLIVPIMVDVSRFGLKRRHLQKHQRHVDRFYKGVIDGREYKCEITETFRKRFVRYRDSLFLFLNEDGIPWNNNMAERAIRHLAVQRKISGSFFPRVADHYLRLLGIAQTCRFQEKSFLRFMLSEKKDIAEFKENRLRKVANLKIDQQQTQQTELLDQFEVIDAGE